MKKNETAIGFIGCGNMAKAIVRALSDQGFSNLTVYDPNHSQTEAVKKTAFVAPTADAVVRTAKYIFLCVKPQAAQEALSGLDCRGKIPVSIMAGIKIATVKAWTGAEKAVRVMPNMNAEVRLSYNAFVCEGFLAEEKAELVEILSAFGMPAETAEESMPAVTGLAGSGPAFLFRFFKGLLTEAEKHGFSPPAAIEMCGMMVAGSVGTVLHSVFSEPPKDFVEAAKRLEDKISAVCSPAGTTIEGIKILNETGFSDTVASAAAKAIKRAEELER